MFSYGRTNVGQPAKVYIHQLCMDTGCLQEEFLRVMVDRDEWPESSKGIRTVCMTWWWCLEFRYLMWCNRQQVRLADPLLVNSIPAGNPILLILYKAMQYSLNDYFSIAFSLTVSVNGDGIDGLCSNPGRRCLRFISSSRLRLQNILTASLQRGKTPHPNEYPGYDTKQSDGEASLRLELWGMRSTPLMPALPDPLWPRVVTFDGSNRIKLCTYVNLNCLK